jgi:hypothetical protein
MRRSLKTTVVAAGAVLCVGLAEVPASGQGAEGEPRVAPGFVFTPSVAMGAIHDDNPVLAGNNDSPPSDVLTTVRPAVDVSYTAKHAFFGGGYRGSLQRFRSLDAYDSYDQGGDAEYRQQFSRRLVFVARDRFSLSPTTDLVEVAGVPFSRTGTTQNTLSSQLTAAAARHLNLNVGYDFQWLHFNRPEQPDVPLLQGGTAHNVTFGVRRALTARIKLGADYGVQRATVGEQLARESFTIQNAQGVVTLRLSPTVTLDAGGGISRLALPGEGGTHFGPAGRIALRKRTEYAFYSISATRSFVPAFGFGGSFRNQEVLGSVRVPFARQRAYIDAGVAWRESEPVLQGELALTALWLKATVGYSFQRWLRLEGFYNGAFQHTTVEGGRIDRTRIGVQAVTGYPMRFR